MMDSSIRKKQLILLAAILLVSAIYFVGSAVGGNSSAPAATSGTSLFEVSTSTVAPALSTTVVPVTTVLGDLVGEDPATETPCTIPSATLRPGTTSEAVTCLQKALVEFNFLQGEVTGIYDARTQSAVVSLQTKEELFVDGVVGRETAIKLGIWPDEQLFVVRTTPPAEGAVDLMGFPLSSVASAGADAPALPPNSGSGRRLVYERAGQRVWAIDKDEQIVRSWLISGSKYANETPGTHGVYSRSEITTAWNGKAFLRKMVRWLKTEIGAIGFHQIPARRDDNSVYQTEAELGTRLSGGCQRQAKFDATFLWSFAKIGTKVVVL